MITCLRTLVFRSLILALVFGLIGCAYNPLKPMIKQGMYADAYHFAAFSYSKEVRKETAEEIKSMLLGQKDQVFKKQIENRFNTSFRPSSYYIDNHQFVRWAYEDGLINRDQQHELLVWLMIKLVADGVKDPTLLADKRVAGLYNTDSVGRYEILKAHFDKGIASGSISIDDLVGFYDSFLERGDINRVQQLHAEVKRQSVRLIEGWNTRTDVSLLEIKPLLNYVAKAKDIELANALEPVLGRTVLFPEDLTGKDSLIRAVFPKQAEAELKKRTLVFNIEIDGDQFLAGEIIQGLREKNKWLKFEEKAEKRIKVGRIRFQERTSPPINRTQTVSNPSFATLLFIPKNASVMFDYTSVDNAVLWNLSVFDEKQKDVRSHSGSLSNKNIECGNFRYQNVFGGTGALSMSPSSEVESFCSSGKGNIEDLRKQAVQQMVDTIYTNYVVGVH